VVIAQHIDNLIGTQFGKKKKKMQQPTGVVTLQASVFFYWLNLAKFRPENNDFDLFKGLFHWEKWPKFTTFRIFKFSNRHNLIITSRR